MKSMLTHNQTSLLEFSLEIGKSRILRHTELMSKQMNGTKRQTKT